jgi:hypothetical protein
MTMPAAATAAASAFIIRLEEEDSGVRDISAIEVTTAASAGAATIFGMELLGPISVVRGLQVIYDAAFGGLGMTNLLPAVPTAGTLTSYLVVVALGSATTSIVTSPTVMAVLDS